MDQEAGCRTGGSFRRVVPTGAAGVDPFVLGIFAWALLPFANIYYGLAQRALDLTLHRIKKKTSLALSRSMAITPRCSMTSPRW